MAFYIPKHKGESMKWIALLWLGCLSAPAWAEQYQAIKDLEVHYSAFNSSFLTPATASQYHLTRNGYTGILNISVLNRAKAGKPSTTAEIEASGKTLLGKIIPLTFKRIKQGDAQYYLAQFPIRNQENISFTINIDAGEKGSGAIKFSQTFYVEE